MTKSFLKKSTSDKIDIYFRYIDFPTSLDRQQKLVEMATETDKKRKKDGWAIVLMLICPQIPPK